MYDIKCEDCKWTGTDSDCNDTTEGYLLCPKCGSGALWIGTACDELSEMLDNRVLKTNEVNET